jgi:hypothetical protein
MNYAIRTVAPLMLIISVRGLVAAADTASIEFVSGSGKVTALVDGLPVATYFYEDDQITRPFFAHVRAPSGIQVTRHHPPIESQDLIDHGTFHPGIWMSFGDISGSDYWRLAARVRHAGFVGRPENGRGKGSFAVRNEYLAQKDPTKVVCQEVARYTFLVRPTGYLLLWDSTFSSDDEFVFGDQEEMGLGVRVAAPLRVGASGEGHVPPGGGVIRDSKGRTNEKEIWGNAADWCDFSGTMAGQHVGMTIFCHPDNFRPSWFHARDYGLLEANPFGRQAFGKGDVSQIRVKPGQTLRLQYGVLLHSGKVDSRPDLEAAYDDYLAVTSGQHPRD